MKGRALHHLRLVSFAEGTSFVLLLFVAMPLKYAAGLPQAVRVAGLVHGLLFVWFVVALALATSERTWPLGRVGKAFVAALLPFGMFVLDGMLRRELAETGTPRAT